MGNGLNFYIRETSLVDITLLQLDVYVFTVYKTLTVHIHPYITIKCYIFLLIIERYGVILLTMKGLPNGCLKLALTVSLIHGNYMVVT